MGNLTIRNLTITPLELKVVERVTANGTDKKPKGFKKMTSKITGRKNKAPTTTDSSAALNDPPTKQDISDITITPFSSTSTPIPSPTPGTDQLLLTFIDSQTSQSYSAWIPGPSPRSIVMKSSPPSKEFTLIYLPSQSHLSIFSSAQLNKWMSKLPPHYPLSTLSIPGTHNSPTCHKALPSVRCQAVPVREQLDNGVRFLDIHLLSWALLKMERWDWEGR